MTRPTLSSVALLATLAMASSVAAQARPRAEGRRVRVTVVEVAGGRAYVEPGAAEGLRRGDTVFFRRRRFQVVAVSEHNAVVEQQDGAPALGDRGGARVRPMTGEAVTRLPAPAPLEAHRSQWPDPRAPALDQTPKPVPLGPMREERTASIRLSTSAAGVVPLSGPADPIGHGILRGRVRYEPLRALPLRFDADVAGRAWVAGDLSSRAGGAARRPLYVRELSLRYGKPEGWNAALGRLRHASAMLGMLDGSRAQAELASGLTLAAFGGAVPDPLDGAPSLDATRFGGELAWEDAELAWRPRVSLGAHGSHFDGAIDERRLDATVDLYPDAGSVGGHVEVSLFDADNPWNTATTQVSAAGVDGRVDLGDVELGGRASLHRPERSRWLASLLPPEWLCAPASPADAVAPGACAGDELYYGGGLDVRFSGERVSLTVGGDADGSRGIDAGQVGGFAQLRVVRLWERLRLDTGAGYSHGSLVRAARANLGLGAELGSVDLSARYQPAYVTYRADVGRFLEHGVGVSVVVVAGRELDVSFLADYLTGRDVDLLMLQTLVDYRPLP